MTLLDSPPAGTIAPSTAAGAAASAHFSANLAAVAQTQPALAGRLPADSAALAESANLLWTFGRDGALTALDASQRWFGGCSIPLVAGRAMLHTLEANALHSCLLLPPHAGLVRAAQERMGQNSALICIVPDEQTLAVILACHDFGEDLRGHRLWFAAGPDWAVELKQLFDAYPGLSTPSRFIKSKQLDEASATAAVNAAQQVFSAVLTERLRRLDEIRRAQPDHPAVGDSDRRAAQPPELLLIAGSRFTLWEDAGPVLAEAMAAADAPASPPALRRFNLDDPGTSSPLALVLAAQGCDAVVSANVARADAANLVDLSKPWITWMTRPTIPSHAAAGPHDALLLADSAWMATAKAAGWPENRLAAAPWPTDIGAAPHPTSVPAGEPHIALITDTTTIEAPQAIVDMSSHLLLWDAIAAELQEDALSLGDDLTRYLGSRAEQLGVDPNALDRLRFIERLILPAFAQGLARLLLRAKVPARLYGRGWEELPDFAAAAHGPLTRRSALQAAAAQAAALVYAWPVRYAHPIQTLGRPVLHAGDRGGLLAQARSALRSHRPTVPLRGAAQPGLAQTVHAMLARVRS